MEERCITSTPCQAPSKPTLIPPKKKLINSIPLQEPFNSNLSKVPFQFSIFKNKLLKNPKIKKNHSLNLKNK